jgi:glyoxylase-like metal-dependent hydrolase (beta-lactamase superfamily II)
MEPREPILSPVGSGITAIDTGMIGERELNAVYLIAGSAPTLVEAGPGADVPVVLAALEDLGVAAEDLAHIVVTHIHLDHAGGAGPLLRHFPRATLWAHERGVPHLIDPSRLVASTARTYGLTRMDAFFGPTEPVPPDRVRSVTDGDRIDLGDRTLTVIHTPGHASHHVAFRDDASGAIFTGEAIGSYLPWGPAFRPALPPPEVDVEQAIASIDRIAAFRPTDLLTSHFGPVPSGGDGCARAKEAILSSSEAVRRILEVDPDSAPERVADALEALSGRSFADQAGRPLGPEMKRYDALGSTAMNAAGLTRYWRKRWEAEKAPPA